MSNYNDKVNKTTQKYIKENYDQFVIRMPKGYKAKVTEYAKIRNISVNKLFFELITEKIKEG